MASYSYKQVYSRLYPISASHPEAACALLEDGKLRLHFQDPPELADIGAREPAASVLILSDKVPYQSATTPDRRYHLEVEEVARENVTEFWLIHTDYASGKYKRLKLSTEWQNGAGGESHSASERPRVTVTPGGTYFVADDNGLIRLYEAPHLLHTATFQLAHPDTDNRTLALAASVDEGLLAGLSSWKNIVLFSVPKGRIIFVRQIRDQMGWYDAPAAHIAFTRSADHIVTVGGGSMPDNTRAYSVNAFRYVSLG